MRVPHRLSLAIAFASSAVVGSGCTDFDREDRLEDTRILAVRTEPAEILYSPFFLTPASQRPPILPLPTVDVAVEVFAFDPRGGLIRTTTQLCPETATDTTCRLYDPQEDLAPLAGQARADVEALIVPRVDEVESDATLTPFGRTPPVRLNYAFTPNVVDFLIPDSVDGTPLPSVFPLLPRVAVQVENLSIDDEDAVVRERASKRIPVALDLASPDLPPDIAADFAAALGFSLCEGPIPAEGDPEPFVEGLSSCLYGRGPNQNPSLKGFAFDDLIEPFPDTLTDDVQPPDIGIGSLLRAPPGTLLAFTPVFGPGVTERYQVVSFDIEASKIILLNRTEDLACTWYTTRGDVSSTLTALQFTDQLGVTWQLPGRCNDNDAQLDRSERECVVSGERDSLVLVVLDQRGGTAVGEVTVEYP